MNIKKLISILVAAVMLLPLCALAEESADSLITFTEAGVQSSADGVLVDGKHAVITKAGTYTLQGKCDGAEISVVTSGKATVTLILNGVELTGDDGPVINAECKNLVLSLADGTQNVLADAAARREPKDDTPKACVYAKNDLTVTGSGALTVSARVGSGIHCKDDLLIEDGVLTVSAPKDALRGNDGVHVTGGTLMLQAGDDGIQTSNGDDGKGNILLSGGSITMHTVKTAFNAAAMVEISGCTVSIWEEE